MVAVVTAGSVAIATSTWDEAKRMIRENHGGIKLGTGRSADFLADGAGVVRDAPATQVADTALTESARIIDGDTLEVRGARVRRHGDDAPESA